MSQMSSLSGAKILVWSFETFVRLWDLSLGHVRRLSLKNWACAASQIRMARQPKLNVTNMVVAFCDIEGTLHQESIPAGNTVISNVMFCSDCVKMWEGDVLTCDVLGYDALACDVLDCDVLGCDVLDCHVLDCGEEINWLFSMTTAPVHSSSRSFWPRKTWLPHLPKSPDLTLGDFSLFLKPLSCKRKQTARRNRERKYKFRWRVNDK